MLQPHDHVLFIHAVILTHSYIVLFSIPKAVIGVLLTSVCIHGTQMLTIVEQILNKMVK